MSAVELLDIAPVVAQAIADDVDIDVYCDEVPPGQDDAFALIRVLEVIPAVPGVARWSRYTVQIDVVGTPSAYEQNSADVMDIGRAVGLVSSTDDVVIADVQTASVRYEPDDAYSPARPRWVLAVEVTARSST